MQPEIKNLVKIAKINQKFVKFKFKILNVSWNNNTYLNDCLHEQKRNEKR